MKNILQITIFLFSIGVFACDCGEPKITEKYIESEFVANVTILKIYPNEKNEKGYKANRKINEQFKGEQLKSIYIFGRSDNNIGSFCDIYIRTNRDLVAYARKNKDENFGIGMCASILYLKNPSQKGQKRELEILKSFKAKDVNYTGKISHRKNKISKESRTVQRNRT